MLIINKMLINHTNWIVVFYYFNLQFSDADMFHVYNSPFQTPATHRFHISPESYLITPGHLTRSTTVQAWVWSYIQWQSTMYVSMVYDFFTNNDASVTFDNNLSIYNSNNNTYDKNLSFIEHQQFVNSPQKIRRAVL